LKSTENAKVAQIIEKINVNQIAFKILMSSWLVTKNTRFQMIKFFVVDNQISFKKTFNPKNAKKMFKAECRHFSQVDSRKNPAKNRICK
jgi:hypothetical protein